MVGCQVVRIRDAREECKEVFLELESDEFFRAFKFHSRGPRRIFGVPCIYDSLSKEVDPAAVGGGET